MKALFKAFIRNQSGLTALHVATAFAVIGIAAAVFVPPKGQNTIERFATFTEQGIDKMVTGTAMKKKAKRYTIRRSVLQKGTGEPCVIMADGVSTGDC